MSNEFAILRAGTDLKVGLFAIGLDTYWSQFKGLLEELKGYLDIVENKLSSSIQRS